MSMKRVAVLGAGGFVGGRTVEMLHLRAVADVRPVVRTIPGLARSARFDLDGRVADAFDQAALTAAFAGVDVVVHAVAGSADVVVGTIAPVYRAASAAGVQRLVYLSSASVHGQAPPPGTDERSALSTRQPVAYNNAKVRAERGLKHLRARGRVEIVVLRPGIVFGPRSSWITTFADALLAGQAYMVNEGRGICNSIYVDNLVHAIHLAATVDGVDGETLIVGDRERRTWRDLYRPITEALGFDLSAVARVDAIRPASQSLMTPGGIAASARTLRALLPARLRRIVRVVLASSSARPPALSPRTSFQPATPRATLEMSLLHSCAYKLPHWRAARVLGYDPVVSFEEGCRRTVGWLGFAGYPVREDAAAAGAGARTSDYP
jgi:nucleoside-diphosphate-sugar epimerase